MCGFYSFDERIAGNSTVISLAERLMNEAHCFNQELCTPKVESIHIDRRLILGFCLYRRGRDTTQRKEVVASHKKL